jgi:CDP-diacylglycerol--serine O-phosphatidyltransferase
MVSLLNGALGFLVMWAAMAVRSGNQTVTARIGIMILICVVCDLVDGTLARCRGGSRWGAALDSTADAISFGAAPAMLVLTQTGSAIPVARWIAALAFVLAAMLRLARFARRPRRNGLFEGLPTTMAAPSVLALVLLRPPDLLKFIGVLVLAGLMISSAPFPVLRGRYAAMAVSAAFLGGLLLVPVAVHQTWFTAVVRVGAALELAVVCGAPFWALRSRR